MFILVMMLVVLSTVALPFRAGQKVRNLSLHYMIQGNVVMCRVIAMASFTVRAVLYFFFKKPMDACYSIDERRRNIFPNLV